MRSIPAWAGEPIADNGCGCHGWVYPRVGGGTIVTDGASGCAVGLSPRGRGNRRGQSGVSCRYRSIPAWAGEPGSLSGPGIRRWVYPRVGGGTFVAPLTSDWESGLSPRGRGNQRPVVTGSDVVRSIPAWAGGTRANCSG